MTQTLWGKKNVEKWNESRNYQPHKNTHLIEFHELPRKRDTFELPVGNIGPRVVGETRHTLWDIVFVNEQETMKTAIYEIKRKRFRKRTVWNCFEDKRCREDRHKRTCFTASEDVYHVGDFHVARTITFEILDSITDTMKMEEIRRGIVWINLIEVTLSMESLDKVVQELSRFFLVI